MKKTLFTGAGVAIVTPFNEDKSVNFDSLAKMIDFQIENGTDAIIICGTTGEASTLTDDEQVETIRFTAEHTKKRVPVIAGAGSNDTAHCINLAKRCESAGVDGLLMVTPYYNKTTQRGLVKYYSTIASNVDIPIIMYSVAGRTGLNIAPDTVKELSKIENIVALKEASGNLSQVATIAAECGDDIDIYSGNDDQILPVLSLGGKGVISVLSNVAPKDTHDMVTKFLSGDIKGAKEIQLKAIELISALFCEVNPIPVTAALNMMGMNAGGYREPLIELSDEHYKRVETAMKNYGLI
ncbi:MAG: 4-hydroxy-tetrahydrodipicolinate synthase [Firmicutes bacterium]|nr:4-hydroxy-tetrahydrodipicolinate synthase [Bacillota bacterium]